MMGYGSYQLWQVERTKTDAERRQADEQLGMMAADVSRFFRGITAPVRGLARHRHPRPASLASPPCGSPESCGAEGVQPQDMRMGCLTT
jgi:hypothetical protein